MTGREPVRLAVFVPLVLVALAEATGRTADAGLDVETVQIRSSDDQRNRLLSGDCDLGITALDNLLVWNAAGADLVVVAQLERTTSQQLVARLAHHCVEDLRGARIGVDAPGNGFAVVLLHLLARHGIGRDEVTLDAVGGVRARYEALLDGRVDATLLGPPFDASATDRGLRPLVRIEDALPDLPGMGLIARASRLGDLPVAALVAALEHARLDLERRPRDEVAELVEATGLDLDAVHTAYRTRTASLVPSAEVLEHLRSMRAELHMLDPAAPAADTLVDAGPAQRALTTVLSGGNTR